MSQQHIQRFRKTTVVQIRLPKRMYLICYKLSIVPLNLNFIFYTIEIVNPYLSFEEIIFYFIERIH